MLKAGKSTIKTKDSLTFQEAMFHLEFVFNKETFQKLRDAIQKEIKE